MNINELKRRRNKAVRQRNKSRTTGKTYKNRRMAKKVAAHNGAAKARARVNKMKQQRKAPNKKSTINLKKVNALNNRIRNAKQREAKPKSSWSLFG